MNSIFPGAAERASTTFSVWSARRNGDRLWLTSGKVNFIVAFTINKTFLLLQATSQGALDDLDGLRDLRGGGLCGLREGSDGQQQPGPRGRGSHYQDLLPDTGGEGGE